MYENGWIKKSGIRAQIPWNALSTTSGTSQLIARTAVRLFQFPKYLLRRMNHILYTEKRRTWLALSVNMSTRTGQP